MLQIHHHISPYLLAPAAVIYPKRQLRPTLPHNLHRFILVTSLNLPLLGKLSSPVAELAEKNTTYK